MTEPLPGRIAILAGVRLRSTDQDGDIATMQPETWVIFAGEDPADVQLVGGKGASLLELVRGGFPVPPFFVLTTRAWEAAQGAAHSKRYEEQKLPAAQCYSLLADLSDRLREVVGQAYERLGGGAVAVRSSAVAEDSHEASFAGQQETILGVEGLEAVVQAIVRCWASAASERVRVYRSARETLTMPGKHPSSGSDTTGEQETAEAMPMAVVVQRLIEAEVAGVLFTCDPTDATGEHLLVEAAWGLGEGVVSGKVMPDRYRVRRQDGVVVCQEIAEKSCCVRRNGLETVPESLRPQPCLIPEQLAELTRLALRVEQHYGEARDVEWAWAAGQFWVLQARPITTVSAWERESYRRTEIERLRQLAEPRGTVWARYNLAESLTVPTPMTWAVLRQFMSGRGGYGALLRDVGFDPDPRLDDEGFLDLVGGRPYVNLSREPWCYFRHFPFWYPFSDLKADPTRALYPRPKPDWSRLSWRFWLNLPWTFWKMVRQVLRLNRLAGELPQRLREEVYPAFAQSAQAARRESLAGLSDRAVWQRFRHWQEATLVSFARQALQPTVVLGHLLGTLESILRKVLPPSQSAQAVRELLVGVRPDPQADVAGGLEKLMGGEWSLAEFLEQFGHRGELEMELAQPRWEELPEKLLTRLGLTVGDTVPSGGRSSSASPASATARGSGLDEIWPRLSDKLRQSGADTDSARQLVERVRECAALRETSRHYLLLGYSILRQCLVELGHRWQLGDGIFYLTPVEIERLLGISASSADSPMLLPTELEANSPCYCSPIPAAGSAFQRSELPTIIRQRRRQRQIALTLEVPTVLFSDDLEALGRPLSIAAAGSVKGIAVSPGVGEGPALVLHEPHRPAEPCSIGRSGPPAARRPTSGYVLVCPSTDPAWVPLFLEAAALVMETGGVLSHGAIVAREFGLPAVVGIPDACQRFRTGQRLRVNGNTGEVQLLDEPVAACTISRHRAGE